MTPFAVLQSACGLSNREAALFLSVVEDTVDKWRSGARRAPPGVMCELAELVERIEIAAAEAAEAVADELAAREPDAIEIGFPADDYEAQALGLPCVGAWRHLAGLVLAALVSDGVDPRRIALAPRGATAATALAIEAREGAL